MLTEIGYSDLIALLLGGVAGFLAGAAVFLGFGSARTTADVRRGAAQDKREGSRRRCGPTSARFCPLHGHCICHIGDGEDAWTEVDMDNRSCPLHGSHSLHGAA